jgi:WD40 repeat protein
VASASPGPGAQLWAARYGTTEFENSANAVKVSPDGRTVFVTGSTDSPSGLTFATIAYNAATGTQLWFARYQDPYNLNDYATSLAVSPDGATVYVTGVSGGESDGVSSYDYATIAYNAATGNPLWVARYNGPGNGDDKASSVVVSPSGGTVFVTGQSAGTTSRNDYAMVAYDAATGNQLWAARYNGPGNRDDYATAAAVSPDGKTVFVTGYDTGATSGYDYGTVAYNAATGHELWHARYHGPATLDDNARSITVSPGGGRVFVTGQSAGTTSNYDYATIAYRAPNGVELWAKRYNGPGNRDDRATSVVASPSGETVYATGESPGTGTGYDYATVAYEAATGHRLWLTRYNGPADGNDSAQAAAVSPTTGTVFVTGQSAGTGTMEIDFATVAYQG